MNDRQLKRYVGEIGCALSKLGNELQNQADSDRPLNIHGQVRTMLEHLTYYLHNLNSDLDACRFDFIKDGNCDIDARYLETMKSALHHLLNGDVYTHNGESSNVSTELHNAKFLVDSLYRLSVNGAKGRKEYIFDKITDKDR